MKTWKPLTSHPHLKQLWATYRGSRVWIFGVCWLFLWQTIKYNMLQIIVNRLFKDQLGAKRDMNNFNLCNIYFFKLLLPSFFPPQILFEVSESECLPSDFNWMETCKELLLFLHSILFSIYAGGWLGALRSSGCWWWCLCFQFENIICWVDCRH